MRTHFFAVTGLLLIAPVSMALAAPITSVSQLIVFGDSLSDNGNAASVATPLGLWPANDAPNAVTDGPNTTPPIPAGGPQGLWIDQFAAKLGLPDPLPVLVHPLTGTNYAVATAQTGTGQQDVGTQIAAFEATHLGSAPSNALYTVWAGANDLTNGKSPTQAADNLASYISTLAASGAKDFLWLNLPPLGDTPLATAGGPSVVATLNAESNAFNAEWSTDLTHLQGLGIDVIGVNIDNLFNQILSDPSLYGLTNVTTPAQGMAGVNPDTYLFWDDEHPTTAADALIAQLAYNDFTGVSPTSVPEPATVALIAFGGVALARLKRRRKQRPC